MELRVEGISDEQYAQLMVFKRLGVLTKTCRAHRQDQEVPPVDVSVVCGDGKRILRALKFHGQGLGRLMHPVTLIGGGIGFHPRSPLNNGLPFPSQFLYHQIELAARAMQTREIAVYAHFPCGGARMFGLSMPQQIELNLLGAGHIREHFLSRGFTVTPFIHALYANPGLDSRHDETFEINLEAWLETREEFRRELASLPVRLTEFVAA